MQDMIILGMLQFKPMSSYDIKKNIEQTTSNFYNASMGSIHPALKKLAAKQAVDIQEKVENGRLKKIYTINQHGREIFNQWMSEGINIKNNKNPTLAKLYFLGFTDKAAQMKHLTTHIALLEKQYRHLHTLQQQLSGVQAQEGFEDHLTYQLATLDYGLESNRFMHKWYEKLLNKIMA